MSQDIDFLSHEDFDALLALSRIIELPAGEQLVRQGEASDAAYFLAEGSMSVYVETPYGEAPLATYDAPRLMGEIGALANLPRTASIRAASHAKLYVIERAQLISTTLADSIWLFWRLIYDNADNALAVVARRGRG